MDIGSGSDKLECLDVSSFGGLQSSLEEKKSPDCADYDYDFLVFELEHTLAENLYIKEGEQPQVEQVSSDGDDIGNKKEKHDCEGPKVIDKPKYSQKLLNKCASFPCPAGTQQDAVSSEKKDEQPEFDLKKLFSEESHRNVYTRSISFPAPLKLVSAMKGSREKHGDSPRKLSVSWAPDVYDPIPTSLSHTVGRGSKKQQRYKNNKKNWKNGKKGQKGNSSRGGNGKEKKQSRKVSGNSNGCYKSMEAPEKLIEPKGEFSDLTVGSPGSQPFCGTSFLKKSLTKMHYPVAEAL